MNFSGPLLQGGTRPLVKIGLAAPFEGLDRPLGYEALAGVKLALAERNAAGGIGGHMVALNDFGDPDEARLQAREFAADPAVLGVVTGWSGETAQASLSVYREMGLAVVVPWSVPPELADPDAGVVLMASDARQMAGVLAKTIAASEPGRLVVVGAEPDVSDYAEPMITLGLSVEWVPPPRALDSEAYEIWTTRLVLSRVRPPDVLVLATDGVLAGRLLQAMGGMGWTGKAFGSADVGSVHFLNVAGQAANGLIFVSPSPGGRDVLHTAHAGSSSEKDDWGPRAVLAYDATHVLLDAVELAVRQDGYPSRQGVVASLPVVQRRGITGAIAFDASGRRTDAPVWLYEIVHTYYPGRVLRSPKTTTGK